MGEAVVHQQLLRRSFMFGHRFFFWIIFPFLLTVTLRFGSRHGEMVRNNEAAIKFDLTEADPANKTQEDVTLERSTFTLHGAVEDQRPSRRRFLFRPPTNQSCRDNLNFLNRTEIHLVSLVFAPTKRIAGETAATE